MLFAKFYEDDKTIDIHLENESFFTINESGKKLPTTRIDVCSYIADSWTGRHEEIYVEKENDTFVATCPIIVYDWISIDLYGYGTSKEEAIKNVEDTYDRCVKYYEAFEENIEKNKKAFFSKVHKFGFLPIDRNHFDVNDKHLPESELVFFEDNDLDFRENAFLNGIPSDARADSPIFGYVDGKKIVFSKDYFIKNSFQREDFLKTIRDYHKIIATHYNLDDYEVYEGCIDIYRYGTDENGHLRDSLINETFEYLTPIKKFEEKL